MNNKVTYFDSFGVEHIPKEIKKIIKGSIYKFTIITNIFRMQAYDSVMSGYFCIGFIDFMFKGKALTDFTNMFSWNDFKKNDDIILKLFFNLSLKMAEFVECNSTESYSNETSDFNNQQFRLSKINEIKDYFMAEI